MLAPQLPTILGAFAAMLVTFIGLLNGASSSASLMKAAAAFFVFAGIGLILRYVLLEAQDEPTEGTSKYDSAGYDSPLSGGNLDVIVPGTSVADVLATQETEADDQAAA